MATFNQNELRERLVTLIKENPKPLYAYAGDIGISGSSLLSFLKYKKSLDTTRLQKIEHYIFQKEIELLNGI